MTTFKIESRVPGLAGRSKTLADWGDCETNMLAGWANSFPSEAKAQEFIDEQLVTDSLNRPRMRNDFGVLHPYEFRVVPAETTDKDAAHDER